MDKYLSSRLLKIATFVGIIVILMCVSSIVIWKLNQYRWIDKSIVTDLKCTPPCWQGITPGVTTGEQALKILTDSPYIKQESIKQVGNMKFGGCTWDWRYPGRRVQSGLNWQSEIVESIRLDLTFDLTVQEVIERFGNPEAVSVVEGGQPENWYWLIVLRYPSQGIELTAYTHEFSEHIEPTTMIGAVLLYPRMNIEEMMKLEEESLSFPLPKDYFSDWQGYGNVPELYGGGRQWP